jgi:endonuclease/exonuclease/phosphatase family metal-dependent hydrolase
MTAIDTDNGGAAMGVAWRPTQARRLLVLLAALLLAGCAPSFGGPELVLATWNLEHLAAADGAGCRPRGPDDYAELRAIARRLDADVVALQEVENAAAVARVFDPARYDILVSQRPVDYDADCRGMPGQARTPLRTGFAIDRDRLAALGLRWQALPPLRALGTEGRRWGLRIALERVAGGSCDAPMLELMAVHLKSGCSWGELAPDDRVRRIRRAQCLVLRRQRGIIEEWIDARAAADQPFAVIGDFNRQLDQPDDDFWNAVDDGRTCTWRADADLGRRCLPGSQVRDPDADLRLANAGRPFPYPYNPRYPYAIDHLVFGGAAAQWVIGRSYRVLGYDSTPPPSDHHAIRITLRLP